MISDHTEQVWIWTTPDQVNLYYDPQEIVRFRIESEKWVDQSPLGPNEKEEGLEKTSPYAIEGSMMEEGLGPVLWWD